MTIIHVLIGFGGGGVENFVLNLSRKYVAQGIRVRAVSVTSHDIRRKEFEEAGIECFSLNLHSLKSLVPAILALYKIVKGTPNAFLHAHGFHALMLCVLVRLRLPRLKMVFTLHTNFIKSPARKMLLFVTKKIRNADIIFSDDAKKWYNKTQSVVIANGVDTAKYQLPLRRDDLFTFLFLGRLEEVKNPLYLLELAAKLKDQIKFKVAIAGYGSLLPEITERIEKYQLHDQVEILGYRKDTPELMSKSHCVILPSLWEGMPIVILEAGAAGVPIISTPVGSIPSILNQDNSQLGSLEQFPQLMCDVVRNYDMATSKAKKLQTLVIEKFSIDASVQKHLNLYHNIYNN